MGDVGSLALGGAIGTVSVVIKQELLLPFIGGIFVLEAVSVILQVGSYKLRKKRIFKMAPLHHHFELMGWSESKVIVRFWIAALVFALLALTTPEPRAVIITLERMRIKREKDTGKVGLGKSGLAAALFLRRHGAQVTVSDLRSAQALSKEIPSLLEAGIVVEAGGHGLLTFRRQDLIVVSPGVPLSNPGTGAGTQSGATHHRRVRTGRPLSQGKGPRHNRFQRKDHHHHPVRRNFCRGVESPGRRQYRIAGHRRRGPKSDDGLVCPRSVQLPIGDHAELSPACCRNSQHHPRPPGPAWIL